MFRIKFTEAKDNPGIIIRDFLGNPIDEYSDMFDRFTEAYGIRALIADDLLAFANNAIQHYKLIGNISKRLLKNMAFGRK